MTDIVIVGGGPAGSMAARALSRDHDVVVLEEHAESGTPMQCAGILTDRAIGMSSVTPDIYTTFSRAKVVFPDGRVIDLQSDTPFANAVDRTDLDRRLAESAMDAGAEYRYSTRYLSHTFDGRVECDTSAGPIHARAIVGADGHSSRVAMSLGDNQPKEYVRGMEADVSGVRGDPDTITLYLGHDVAPGFFAWEMPCGDFTRIGLCASWGYGPPNDYLKHLLDRVAPDSRVLARYSGKIPIGGRRRISGPGCLLTGDAAGFVKPVSGGGLYPTFRTIPVLEDVLSSALADGDASAESLSRYDSGCRALIGKELDRGYRLRRRYARMDDGKISLAGSYVSRPRIASALRGIDFDQPSATVRSVLKDPRNLPAVMGIVLRCIL